jgi:hypothetical protein
MKVAELEGALLDAWVARAEGYDVIPAPTDPQGCWVDTGGTPFPFRPSTDWAQGGQIIEREDICVIRTGNVFLAMISVRLDDKNSITCDFEAEGPTYLIAATRAYVASKFSDTVEDS